MQEMPITSTGKVIGNSKRKGGGGRKPKYLKESMKLKWNF